MEFKLDVDLTSNVSQVKEEVIRQARLGLKAAGETAAGYARENCPVDTGLLRNSIASGLAGDLPRTVRGGTDYSDNMSGQKSGYTGRLPAARQNELTVYIGSNVEYAPYVEFCEYNHVSGKPHFLRDAIQDNLDELAEIVRAALTK